MNDSAAHLWVRAEQRDNERRVGITPEGAAELLKRGVRVTIEDSPTRSIPIKGFAEAGCNVAHAGDWVDAPKDAIIFGLKELPDDGSPLPHRHIMFGHAFKGQPAGVKLLHRFKSGGGTLYDLEYLVDDQGRRVAAFGYWAGYVGAAIALKCWATQRKGGLCESVRAYSDADTLESQISDALAAVLGEPPIALVVGAAGRVGTGATELCDAVGVSVNRWDLAETAHGGPFPEILDHDLFLNCVLAGPDTPVFVPSDTSTRDRRLAVIGDISCDPESDYSPIKVYDRVTNWDSPALRVHQNPPLDVTAIDNLPSLLPTESSIDFAGQMLPSLSQLASLDAGVWARAKAAFDAAMARG